MKNNLSIAERNKIVVENMGLVTTILKQYSYHHMHDDLEQEGYLGLIAAVEHYNNPEVTFSSYAAWWVRKYINDALRRYSMAFCLPQHCVLQNFETVSYDMPISEEDGDLITLSDILANDSCSDAVLMQQDADKAFEALLSQLSPRELEILDLHYGLHAEPLSTVEIAQRIGLSVDRVYRIMEKSFKKLR